MAENNAFIPFAVIILIAFFAHSVHGAPQPIDNQLDYLARIIYAEARGEPYLGQVAVGAVVLNRVRSPHFPNTIEQVLYEKHAFQPIQDGQFYGMPNDTAYQAAREALGGHDPTGGALYFYNPAKVSAGNWIWNRPILKQIGSHIFAL